MALNRSGRIKGAKNIKTFNVEEIASKYDIDPIDVFFMVMRGDREGLNLGPDDEHIKLSDKLDAAKSLSKFLYSAKQAVTVQGGVEPIIIEVLDYVSKKK